MTTALEKNLSGWVRNAPYVYSTSTCRDTLRVMFQHPESKCIVVCNAENEPLGLLMSEGFFLIATGRLGVDLFYKEPVMNYMNRKPLIADVTIPLDLLRTEARIRSELDRNDCIILTRNGKYAGVLNASDLHLV